MARKEKKQRSGTIFAFVIAFIMIFSVVGYVGLERQNSQFKYNGIKFTQDTNSRAWSTIINERQLTFDYFPSEVEYINLSSEIDSSLSNKPEVDTTSEINDTFSEEIALAQYNMALTMNSLNIYLRRGFAENSTFNLPIITCRDATPAVPVIYFKQSNETKVTLENSCIIAEARNSIEILRIKDRLLYSMLGIIR